MPRSLALVPLLSALLACSGTIEASGGSGGGGGSGGSGGGGAPPACDAPAAPPDFWVGTGETCFEAVGDGAVLPLMNGPQGGYHVWMAVGCTGACASATQVRYGVELQDTGAYVTSGIMVGAAALLGDASWRSIAGLQAPMPGLSWDPMTDPPLPAGSLLRLHAEGLDDAGNVLVESSVDFVLGDTQFWDPCSGDPNDPNCQLG